MDGGFPHPGTMPLNNIKNGMTPNDQVSVISSNSHAIKRPFSSLDLPKPSGPGVRPSSVHAQSVAGYQSQIN